MHLAELTPGTASRIAQIEAHEALAQRLLEMGIEEGMEVRLLHVGPIRRDPLVIAVNDRCIALRRSEARHIIVQPLYS